MRLCNLPHNGFGLRCLKPNSLDPGALKNGRDPFGLPTNRFRVRNGRPLLQCLANFKVSPNYPINSLRWPTVLGHTPSGRHSAPTFEIINLPSNITGLGLCRERGYEAVETRDRRGELRQRHDAL
jgi:hypothetical protein